MLVLGISPAEAFGCLCAERIAGQRGVAVQCLPDVVRCHPQAGRPRDLLLHGREQAPPSVLISHEERLGALHDWHSLAWQPEATLAAAAGRASARAAPPPLAPAPTPHAAASPRRAPPRPPPPTL